MCPKTDDETTNDATSDVGSATNDEAIDDGNQINSINAIFRAYDQNGVLPPLIINCKLDEKVSDIIEKYRNKSGDMDPNKIFVFNAKKMNPNLTVEETGIVNNGNIFVVSKKQQ